MKTFILNGSPRKSGDSASLLAEFRRGLPGDVDELHAYSSKILPCADCRYCRKKPGCSINDDMDAVYNQLQTADLVVISSPVHFGAFPGPLMSVIGRLQTYFSAKRFRGENPFPTRHSGALLLSGGSGKPDFADRVASEVFLLLNRELTAKVFSLDTDSLPAREDDAALLAARRAAEMFAAR